MTEVTPNLPHLGNFCKYCFMGTLLSVTHIFSKPNYKKKYTDLLFMDRNSNLTDLPDEIKLLLDEGLLTATSDSKEACDHEEAKIS